MEPFQTRDVSSWIVASDESLGSKDKVWLRPEAKSRELWLYKRCRADAGDDWAEKVAEQLADLIHVPHARVELAGKDGERGVIVRDFRQVEERDLGVFIPGNELLWQRDATYPRTERRKIAQYTVDRCLEIIHEKRITSPFTGVHWQERFDATTFFVGYLLFDAWIGNQDRHHENWGVLALHPDTEAPSSSLSPSFDHASSLGQNLTDRARELRLTTSNPQANLETWARKAASCFCAAEPDERSVTTMDAFGAATRKYPNAGTLWLDRLRNVNSERVEEILAAVPTPLLSSLGRRFTFRLLDVNRRELLHRFSP